MNVILGDINKDEEDFLNNSGDGRATGFIAGRAKHHYFLSDNFCYVREEKLCEGLIVELKPDQKGQLITGNCFEKNNAQSRQIRVCKECKIKSRLPGGRRQLKL